MHLHLKQVKMMSTEERNEFVSDSDHMDIVRSFVLLGPKFRIVFMYVAYLLLWPSGLNHPCNVWSVSSLDE